MKYLHPEVFKHSFTCPYCGTISQQSWWSITWDGDNHFVAHQSPIRVSLCTHCGEHTIWVEDKMYFPDSGNAPFPNPEMPSSVRKLYQEAASIHSKSPRGAAALLRLAIQVLCKELGEAGTNINNDIGNLVKKGLPKIVQQSLDIVRVTGNDAVHPGQINTDDLDTVSKLFELVNIIVEYMIEMPLKVQGLYSALPDEKKEGIEKRDKK